MVSAPGHHAGKLTVVVVVVRVRGPSHPPYTGARQKLPPGGLRTALAVDTTHPLALRPRYAHFVRDDVEASGCCMRR